MLVLTTIAMVYLVTFMLLAAAFYLARRNGELSSQVFGDGDVHVRRRGAAPLRSERTIDHAPRARVDALRSLANGSSNASH
ncbi:hypothetical protein BH23DEI1_BH23DEI1_24690 [soil metagenome]